jgi:hypothetical protein
MTTPAAGEQRLSTIVGHRLCACCGFSLTGQTIVREPHYGMLMARCPECGAVAALQEYPSLGRWAGRWAAVLAATWLVVLIAALFVSAAAMFGSAEAVVDDSCKAYAEAIATAHAAWLKSLPDPTTSPAVRMNGGTAQPPQAYGFIDSSWWKSQDTGAFLRAQGGWWNAIGRDGLWMLWMVLLVGGCVGIFWTIALLARRRRAVLIAAVLVTALASVFAWLNHASEGSNIWFAAGVTYAQFLARDQLALRIIPVALSVGFCAACAGVWLGRPIARFAARALLPPSFLGPLAVLWTCDGLPPPRTLAHDRPR